jgi:hypothetical protein
MGTGSACALWLTRKGRGVFGFFSERREKREKKEGLKKEKFLVLEISYEKCKIRICD